MTRKRNRMRKSEPVTSTAQAKTALQQQQYLDWMFSLLLQRYQWRGLPDTINERFLETTLAIRGCATIGHDIDLPDVWLGLQVSGASGISLYGDPTKWDGQGKNGDVMFSAREGENAVLVWDRRSRVNMWGKYNALAQKLALYARTEDQNLIQQFTPWVIAVPEEELQSAQTVLGMTLAGNPAIVGYSQLSEMINGGFSKLDLAVPWMGDKLQKGAIGVWGEFFRIAGIPHLQFEKSERMITDEAETTLAPTRLSLEDGLKSRRDACAQLARIGLEGVEVDVNPVIMSMFGDVGEGGDDGERVSVAEDNT